MTQAAERNSDIGPAPGYCGNILPQTIKDFVTKRGWWEQSVEADGGSAVYVAWDMGDGGFETVKLAYLTVPLRIQNEQYPFAARTVMETIAIHENVDIQAIFNGMYALQQREIFESAHIFNQYQVSGEEVDRLAARRDRELARAAGVGIVPA